MEIFGRELWNKIRRRGTAFLTARVESAGVRVPLVALISDAGKPAGIQIAGNKLRLAESGGGRYPDELPFHFGVKQVEKSLTLHQSGKARTRYFNRNYFPHCYIRKSLKFIFGAPMLFYKAIIWRENR